MLVSVKMQSKLIDLIGQNMIINNLVIVLFGSLFLALSAQIAIPIYPVPVTLQSAAALFVGMIFGPKLSSRIIIAYLIEGFCGLPVFANFSFGPHVLLGPTGGYLIGFVPAAMLVGYLLQQGWAKYRITTLLASLLGTIVLFIPGYFVLAHFIGFHNAYLYGIAPFYIVDAGKIILLAISVPYFWKSIPN